MFLSKAFIIVVDGEIETESSLGLRIAQALKQHHTSASAR
ncbi:hypothetical protein DFR28_10919 [Arenicella xantha]|uniref:Uncharacterized protein n=1 Tax=Arenicella xantha TaxID=644221 RepID=A0A395JKB8_9GAMM|nr:hypothetical protein DFR28_10919 [Arenicella xantha]